MDSISQPHHRLCTHIYARSECRLDVSDLRAPCKASHKSPMTPALLSSSPTLSRDAILLLLIFILLMPVPSHPWRRKRDIRTGSPASESAGVASKDGCTVRLFFWHGFVQFVYCFGWGDGLEVGCVDELRSLFLGLRRWRVLRTGLID